MPRPEHPRKKFPFAVIMPRRSTAASAPGPGWAINIALWIISIRPRRLQKIWGLVSKLGRSQSWRCRDVRSLSGMLMSCSYVFGDSTWIRSRALWSFCSSLSNHESAAPSTLTLLDLQYWVSALLNTPTKPLSPRAAITSFDTPYLVASGASATGLGYVPLLELPGTQPTQPASRPLTKSERDESSTAREMLGIEFSVITNVTQFSGHSVIFLVDNQGCPSIARKGSPVPKLQSIAIRLSDLTIAHNIALHMVWVPLHVVGAPT